MNRPELSAAFVGLAGIGGLCVVMQPRATLAVLFGIAIITVCLAAPKAGAALAVGGILLATTAANVTGIGAVSYLDETSCLAAGIIFPLARSARHLRLRPLPGGRWFLLYAAAGLAGSAVHAVPLSLAATGGFLFLKGPLLAFGLAQIDWTADDLPRLIRAGKWLLVIVVGCCVVNAAMPGWWAGHLSPGFDHRGGVIPTLTGPFALPGDLGQIAALLVVAIIALRTTAYLTGRGGLAGVAAGMAAVLSFRRRAVLGMVAGITATRRWSRRPRTGFYLLLAVTVLGVGIIFHGAVSSSASSAYRDYITNPTAARTLLYRKSVTVANDYAPLGAGFGRYGSYVSGSHYSPEYLRLGLDVVYGLGPGKQGVFFTDTFWPAILGEAGYVGLVGYGMFIVGILRFGRRLARTAGQAPHALGLILVGWSVEYLVESVAAPDYSSPPTFGLLFGLLGVAVAVTTPLGARRGEQPSNRRSEPALSAAHR